MLYTLDTGHYHPTETIADKISAVLMFIPEILLHVSRGVRWDSDHVVVLNDDLDAIAQELVRGGFLQRTHIGLDYFDASINRVAAWVIGTRNMLKALLKALLEPIGALRGCESRGDYTARLALQEEIKSAAVGRRLGLLLRDRRRAGRRAMARRGQRVRAPRPVDAIVSETFHRRPSISVARSCEGTSAEKREIAQPRLSLG